ncbi:MAG: hypothetical protein QOJ03_2288 [Frankiaceae bacterium]|jgi:hypothetical protein|nr:hypothetical protein [Frankiaceae bacterium]
MAGYVTIAATTVAEASQSANHGKVVIIAVPDLRWIDLETMPALSAFARTASVAELSVKTAAGTPRCADGSLTFSAGNRANADHTVVGCRITTATLTRLRLGALDSKFAAHVGAFGQALHNAGLTTAAVGESAVPLLADASGDVDFSKGSLGAALRRADVVATVDDTLYYSPGLARIATTALVDQTIADQLAEVPAGATVMVAGTSDGAATPMHLHALLVRGPGWRHVALRSPSTRAPYVQLRDLAPTLLDVLGLPTPSTMVGRPAYDSGSSAASAVSYADDDDHAVTARDVGKRLRNLLAELGIAVVVLFVAGGWRSDARTAATWLARFGVGIPVFSFLAQLLPWWQWGTWAYTGIVAAGSAALGTAVGWVARRDRVAGLLFGPAVTAAVLVVDQLVGAPLQLSAPLGDNPIVAGRFHGMGNTDFALLCTAAVLIAAVVAGRLASESRRGLGLVVAAGLCLLAMVVDAAPSLGDDFGGLLAMAPVTALLLALLAGVRLSWRRLLLIAVAAALLGCGVALLDYARPVAHQTHVGRFVGQVLHGGAARVVRRKLDASLGSFGNIAITGFVVVTAVAAMGGRRRLVPLLRTVPGLPAAAVAVAVLAVLGTFLNDSGVVVAATTLLLAVFAVVAPGSLARSAADGQPRETDGVAAPRRSDP